MLPAGDANAYAVARRTLVDAVIALQNLSSEAFVLVGAHAVYLRAPENDLGIAPFTLDGVTLPTLRVLRDDRHVGESVQTGTRHLRRLCTGRGAGLKEFSALLGPSEGERTARASLAALVEEFGDTVESVFA